jgi:hypothetical protein
MGIFFIVCLLQVCFCRRFMRLPYRVRTIPLCVKAFYLPKENKKIFSFAPLFLSKPSNSLGGLNINFFKHGKILTP